MCAHGLLCTNILEQFLLTSNATLARIWAWPCFASTIPFPLRSNGLSTLMTRLALIKSTGDQRHGICLYSPLIWATRSSFLCKSTVSRTVHPEFLPRDVLNLKVDFYKIHLGLSLLIFSSTIPVLANTCARVYSLVEVLVCGFQVTKYVFHWRHTCHWERDDATRLTSCWTAHYIALIDRPESAVIALFASPAFPRDIFTHKNPAV